MQKIRVKCPKCGLMSSPEHFRKGPYKVQVFLQSFGGKIPGQRKGRGKAEGMMEYENITTTAEGKRIIKMVGGEE